MLSAERKVLKVGNSLGVTFPMEFLNKLGPESVTKHLYNGRKPLIR